MVHLMVDDNSPLGRLQERQRVQVRTRRGPSTRGDHRDGSEDEGTDDAVQESFLLFRAIL